MFQQTQAKSAQSSSRPCDETIYKSRRENGNCLILKRQLNSEYHSGTNLRHFLFLRRWPMKPSSAMEISCLLNRNDLRVVLNSLFAHDEHHRKVPSAKRLFDEAIDEAKTERQRRAGEISPFNFLHNSWP
jgi:hypothetical protein